jgi:hypothetical protein
MQDQKELIGKTYTAHNMKRLLIIICFLLVSIYIFGQGANTWKYVINANGGLRVGGITLVKIDSITSAAGDIRFWSGGAALTAVPGVGGATWGAITGTLTNQIDLTTALGLKANLISPTFTGTPTVPGYVPTSTTVNSRALTGKISITASDVGLGNVTNESKATMFTNPVLTGTPTVPGYVPTTTTVNGHALSSNVSVTATDVSLGNLTNKAQVEVEDSAAMLGPYGRMMYKTANLIAGANTNVTLTNVTTEPFSVQIFDSDGVDITHSVKDSTAASAGVYHTWIYSTDAKTGAKIKVLW